MWEYRLTRFGTARVYDYWWVAVARTASLWIALPPNRPRTIYSQALSWTDIPSQLQGPSRMAWGRRALFGIVCTVKCLDYNKERMNRSKSKGSYSLTVAKTANWIIMISVRCWQLPIRQLAVSPDQPPHDIGNAIAPHTILVTPDNEMFKQNHWFRASQG